MIEKFGADRKGKYEIKGLVVARSRYFDWLLSSSILLLLILCPQVAMAANSTTYLYRDQTGNEQVFFCWTSQQQKDQVVITSRKLDEIYRNVCGLHGSTRRWEVRKPGVLAKAWVEERQLILKGEVDGRAVSWTKDLQGRTWHQPLSYTLREVALGRTPEITFCCIRPDTLELVGLRAQRMGEEKVQVAGSQMSAVKVRIRMQGLLRLVWHADYWFRTKDGVFIRYQGVNGPSGTPKTTIELINECLAWKECVHSLGCQSDRK